MSKMLKLSQKNQKKTILTDSQGLEGLRAQDLARIGFIGFFGTVTAFCSILIGSIGFIGTVSAFRSVNI